MFNALFRKSNQKTITVIESTGDECMDEFLLVFLGEKTLNSVDVSEMIKSCLGDSFDVAAESQI